MTKRPFTSRIDFFDSLASSSQSFIEIFLVFSVPWVQDRKECIGWMPGHWEGRTLSEAKGHGEIPSVIHGSPIGKPYPSSVASLRSLDFSNLANWNIWVAKGRKINRDPVSSGERERNKGFHQKKSEAVSFDLLWIGWWKNQQAASVVRKVAVARPTELYKVSNRFGAQA